MIFALKAFLVVHTNPKPNRTWFQNAKSSSPVGKTNGHRKKIKLSAETSSYLLVGCKWCVLIKKLKTTTFSTWKFIFLLFLGVLNSRYPEQFYSPLESSRYRESTVFLIGTSLHLKLGNIFGVVRVYLNSIQDSFLRGIHSRCYLTSQKLKSKKWSGELFLLLLFFLSI